MVPLILVLLGVGIGYFLYNFHVSKRIDSLESQIRLLHDALNKEEGEETRRAIQP